MNGEYDVYYDLLAGPPLLELTTEQMRELALEEPIIMRGDDMGWYVSWFIGEGYDGDYPYRHLHRDGVWRKTTNARQIDGTWKYTGYFTTKEVAEEALTSALTHGDPKPMNTVLADAFRAAQTKKVS